MCNQGTWGAETEERDRQTELTGDVWVAVSISIGDWRWVGTGSLTGVRSTDPGLRTTLTRETGEQGSDTPI